MYMWKTIQVALDERVVVLRNGLPALALGPGKHRVWGTNLAERRYTTSDLVFDAPARVRTILPPEWFEEARLGPRQRGVLYRDGKPVRFLRPGINRFWTVDDAVELRIFSVDEPVPELTCELVAVIPRHELVVVTVRQFERGLLYVQGRFERTLDPGQHAFWSHPQANVTIQTLDMRAQQVTLQGQELMTRDKVTLRLTLSLEYVPADPSVVVHTVADVRDTLYLLVQLAARDYVAGVTLDELLDGRDAMTRYLAEKITPKALGFGVAVRDVGVKDVVLPGDMKALLNRVIEAEKEAAANVILRREEAAATRSLANKARVIAENPVLMRLEELEALQGIAGHIDEVRLVVGAAGLEAVLGNKVFDALPGKKAGEPAASD